MSSLIRPLYIVDSSVEDVAHFLPEHCDIYILKETVPPIHEIALLVQSMAQSPRSLHLLAHGKPGQIILSGQEIRVKDLVANQAWLKLWNAQADADASLYIYGCETGQGVLGSHFVRTMADLTGLAVHASSLPVGHADLGGAWDLDVTTRPDMIPAALSQEAMASYRSLFAVTTGTYTFGTVITGVTGGNSQKDDLYEIQFTTDGTTASGLEAGMDIDPTDPSVSGFGIIAAHGALLSEGNSSAGAGSTHEGLVMVTNADGGELTNPVFYIQSNDGTGTSTIAGTGGNTTVPNAGVEFNLNGFALTFRDGINGTTAFTITGFRDNAQTGQVTLNLSDGATTATLNGSDPITNEPVISDGDLGSGFDNIDRFTITASALFGGITIDDLVIATAVTGPTITSAAYNASTGALVVTGTGFTATGGAANDVVANKFTLTGEGGATYTLTDTANVEITSATEFTLNLSATDMAAINQMLNKDGTASTGGTTFNLSGAAGYIAASGSSSDLTNVVTVSNVAAPTVTSAAYDYSTGVLTVTGTGLLKSAGATNDIDVSKLSIAGEGGATYTLTSSNVEITDGTSFSITLNATDRLAVNGLLNKDGTSADDATTYNIAAAEDWNAGADASVNIADLTSNAITVSNYAAPAITSAAYNYSNGQLVLTGTNFVANSGAVNDVDASKFTVTGEGGATYTLTSSASVEITSSTSATITLTGADLQQVEALLNKDGTTSATSATTFNLAAADNWMAGAPATPDISDSTTGVTVSNYAVPAITSAAFDSDTGVLTVTGTNFVSNSGAANDIDITKLTITGQGGATYTLTSGNVDVTSATEFSVTLNAADLVNVRGLLNKDGLTSDDATTYNIAAAEDWMPGAPAANTIADLTSNGITVSNSAVPQITSTTYNATTGVLVLTGTNFVGNSGATNDVDASLLTFTGEGGATYTLTDTSDVELTSPTSATVTLSATDQLSVNGLLNKDGTSSATSATTYNVAAADNWMPGASASSNIADSTTAVTVSNVAAPAISNVAYDFTAGTITLTGTHFVHKAGAANDVDVSKFTITGEGSGTRVLTSSDVEVTSATSATITLNAADKAAINALLNKDGTTSATAATTYNLAVADDWMAGATGGDTSSAIHGITVSNYTGPTLTSADFDFTAGTLALTGTDFVAASGAANDIDVSKLTITGSGGATYTLTSSDVEITNGTSASITLNAADLLAVRGLMDKNGLAADDATTYNIAAAEDWMPGAPAGNNIADLTGNAVTVSNYVAPTVTSATYDSDTGELVVTGTNFVQKTGAGNDVDISTITLTGGLGSSTYTLTSASDVEITNATSFTVTLAGTDKTNVDALLDQVGTTSSGGSTYNIGLADNWMAGAQASADITDATGNAVTVVISPKITSAAYDATTGSLVVTGTNIQANGGGPDIDASTITLTGEGGTAYTLTDTQDVERDTTTQFTLSLSATDKAAVGQILNNAGTSSTGGTTYNIAAADDWDTNVTVGNTADATNALTVSNVPTPVITTAAYNYNTNTLTLTGTGFVKADGATNDIDVSKLTVTGEGAATYTLSSTADVENTSATSAVITLSGADIQQVEALLNKDGTTSATSGTTFNLAAADDWMAGAPAATDISDATTGVTVSNYAVPAITSATFDYSTGVLTVTGTNFVSSSGANNDIDVTKLTLLGEAGGTFTLTTSNVDVTSATGFSVTLSAADLLNARALLNKDGLAANDATTYNIAAAEDWMPGAPAANNIADLAGNGITVSNYAVPQITSTTYDVTTGVLVVTGTNFVSNTGAANDVDASLLTFTGEGAATYTLTDTSDVEVTSLTSASITLSATDKSGVNDLLNADGTTSATSNTTYNVAAADNWMPGAPGAAAIGDATSPVTVSGVSGGAGGGGGAGGTGGETGTTTTEDGAEVTTETQELPNGIVETTKTITPTTSNRTDDPTTQNPDRADIRLAGDSDTDTSLVASLPTGVGLTAMGSTTHITKSQALQDLITRIQNVTSDDPDAQTEGTASGNNFLDALPDDAGLFVQTITPTVAAGTTSVGSPIIISGAALNQSGANQQEALVIDTSQLPSGTILQLDNVEYAYVTGSARVTGGAGSNVVHGDNQDQFIVLGAEDDRLSGGGGQDTIGSEGGRDILSGDAGDDIVFGGSDNDFIIGGTGNDTLRGDQGMDSARFSGNYADYMITLANGTTTLVHGNETDTAETVEVFVFDDQVRLAQNVQLRGAAFDEAAYLSAYDDVAAAVQAGVFQSGYQHFQLYGESENRDGNALFDTVWYLAQNADVAAAVANGAFTAWDHYFLFGSKEDRDPSAHFDISAYLALYSDVATANVDALTHYLNFGVNEDRVVTAATDIVFG